MKEQLYTIPVNDAFDKDCECPICEMYHVLQMTAIEFTLGPSYMEDDVRMVTDKIGFCENHVKLLYQNQNRLGLSLMLLTHMNNAMKELEGYSKSKVSAKGFFKKKDESPAPITEYIRGLEHSCYICRKMEGMFRQYIVTVFYLYRHEEQFRKKLKESKGFCMKHYALLYEEAPQHLKGSDLDDFIEQLNAVFLDNFKRVRDDLEWFTDKFDYRYVNEPWKNSKDALPRAVLKLNSIIPDEM